MSQTRTPRVVLCLALGATLTMPLAASTATAEPPQPLRLRAVAVDLNNRLKTNTVDILIERWSTPEEIANYKAVFLERGEDKLLSALQKTKPRCGFARTSTSLGWDIYFAVQRPVPGGGMKIILASDRPIRVWEARNAGRSTDYQFSLAEIHLPTTGKGEGKAVRFAQLTFNKETNTLEIENYQREPVRLSAVEVVAK